MAPYNPPVDCMYTELPIDNNLWAETMYKVIGKEGRVFNSITYESRCSYIWWNKERNVIEIWGPNYRALNDAKLRLSLRLKMFLETQMEQVACASLAYSNSKPLYKQVLMA